MLDAAKVVESLKKKPEMVHLILTGTNAHPTIVEAAHTMTEMRQGLKPAYEKSVMAQRGIEYGGVSILYRANGSDLARYRY